MASTDELWLVDFGPEHHAEPASTRPALVLGPASDFGAVPFVVVAPLTTVRRRLSWHVEVEPGLHTGLSETSYVQCELMRSIGRGRFVHHLGVVPPEVAAAVSEILRTLLNLGHW